MSTLLRPQAPKPPQQPAPGPISNAVQQGSEGVLRVRGKFDFKSVS